MSGSWLICVLNKLMCWLFVIFVYRLNCLVIWLIVISLLVVILFFGIFGIIE